MVFTTIVSPISSGVARSQRLGGKAERVWGTRKTSHKFCA